MIKNLLGDYETVEYENKRFVMLYDNVETETYPTHWHNAVEIIMPLQNSFVVYIGETKYVLNEREIIIIPLIHQDEVRALQASQEPGQVTYDQGF